MGQPRRGEAEVGREEALMSNICLISHHLYDVGKLTVLGSSTLPEIAFLNFNSCFYKLSTRNPCFTTSLFTRFLFMVTKILRKAVLFCHHSKTQWTKQLYKKFSFFQIQGETSFFASCFAKRFHF